MFKIGIIGAGWIAAKMAQALAPLQDMEVHAIASRSLEKAFTEIGIKKNDFAMMAAKACRDGNINGFKTLAAEDVEKIYEMCL
jgi:predicted dehydrogenase